MCHQIAILSLGNNTKFAEGALSDPVDQVYYEDNWFVGFFKLQLGPSIAI